MIIALFFLGFILGLAYSLIGDLVPTLLPDVTPNEENSWVLNLFVGVLHGLFLLISYYNYGIGYEFFLSLIIAALVFIIFISDFKYMIILDSPLIIGSILIFGLKYYYFGLKMVGISILSGISLFVFMLIIGFLGKRIFKKEALGGGDIKLCTVIGIILNWKLGLVAIILSSLLAMPYALASLMLNKDKEVPFGPFLIGSMAIVFFFSDKFLNLIHFLF